LPRNDSRLCPRVTCTEKRDLEILRPSSANKFETTLAETPRGLLWKACDTPLSPWESGPGHLPQATAPILDSTGAGVAGSAPALTVSVGGKRTNSELAQTALLTHSGRGSALAGPMQLSRTTSHGSGSSGATASPVSGCACKTQQAAPATKKAPRRSVGARIRFALL
jgi:hypothetical protein